MLTKKQKSLMFEVREEWKNLFLHTKEINKKDFEESVNFIYTELLYRKKPKIVYCENWVIYEIKRRTLDNTGDGISIWTSIWESTGDSLKQQIPDSLWASAMKSVFNPIMEIVGAPEINTVIQISYSTARYKSQTENASMFFQFFSFSNFAWVALFDFFERIGAFCNEIFKAYKNIFLSGAFHIYEYENTVMAIEPLQIIETNSQGELHSFEGMALQFKDKSGFYYLNGRNIPKWVFEKYGNPDYFDLFRNEENEGIKSGVISLIKEREGNEGLLKFLKAELIDEKKITHFESYTETLRLYKTKEKYTFLCDRNGINNQPYCWSEFTCPSTGATYLIDNSADFTCAIEASKFLRPSFIPMNLAYKWEHSAN